VIPQLGSEADKRTSAPPPPPRPGAFAQTVTHVTNPLGGATFYVNPDWINEVKSAAAAQPTGSTLANQMAAS